MLYKFSRIFKCPDLFLEILNLHTFLMEIQYISRNYKKSGVCGAILWILGAILVAMSGVCGAICGIRGTVLGQPAPRALRAACHGRACPDPVRFGAWRAGLHKSALRVNTSCVGGLYKARYDSTIILTIEHQTVHVIY